MTRIKQPQGFPQAYYKVIESVSNTGKPFTFARDDRRKAELLRFQLYAFIKACRASTEKREQLLGQQAYGLVFSVKGNDLVITLRDNANEAQELEAALQEYEKEASPTRPKTATVWPEAVNKSPAPAPSSGPSHEDMVNRFMNKKKD